MRRKRRGFTIIELLVVILIIGLLVVMLFPALQMVIERSRFIQCTTNMKQFGVAMKAYVSTHGVLPPGVMIRTTPIESWDDALKLGAGFRGNAVSSLLGYFEAKGVQDLYNTELDWWEQPITVAQARIDLFICPSSTQEVLSEPLLAQFGGDNTRLVNFSPCHYIVSKGVSDAWCLPVIRELVYRFAGTDPALRNWVTIVNTAAPNHQIPPDEKGPFEINSSVRMEDIRDGEQNTILMGECATGPKWKVCSDGNPDGAPGFPSGSSRCALKGSFVSPANPAATTETTAVPVMYGVTNQAMYVKWAWLPSLVMPSAWENQYRVGYVSNFGCTVWPLNMNPVPSSWVRINTQSVSPEDVIRLADCRSVYMPANQDGGDPALGHRRTLNPARWGRASAFHSDHSGGGNFLFADSHVEFISESIDIAVYRGLSSIAGNDNAQKN